MADREDRASVDWEAGAPLQVSSEHGCFGCGRLNPHGLRLSFRTLPPGLGHGVWAPFTPERIHEGYAGLIHGGIISTVLDEAMAWALYAREAWAVTARLSVTFRKPAEVGVPMRVVGRPVADRGRILEVAGELRREVDDALLAESTGSFVRVPAAQAREWRARYLGSDGLPDT